MTCIAWDGKILASDDRSMVARDNVFKDGKCKIVVPKVMDHWFANQRIHALTGAGNSSTLHKLHAMLLKRKGDESKSFNIVNTLRGSIREGYSLGPNATLVLLCTHTLIVINYRGGLRPEGVDVTELDHKDSFVTGSGASIAGYLMRHQGVPADIAVAAASTYDNATGSLVSSIRLKKRSGTTPRVEILPTQYFADNAATNAAVRAAMK